MYTKWHKASVGLMSQPTIVTVVDSVDTQVQTTWEMIH